jgi:glycogen operon protein
MRNLMATLLLSQGVPMILSGDELQRTKLGNNNTYCQDNTISWLNWQLDKPQQEFLEFTRFLSRFFHQHPVLRRRKFFQGTPVLHSHIKDLTWFHPNADEISDEEWENEKFYAFGLLLAGNAIPETDERGNRVIDDTLLILFNAAPDPCTFTLPDEPTLHLSNGEWEESDRQQWELVLDTREALPQPGKERLHVNATYSLAPRSLALFCWPRQK